MKTKLNTIEWTRVNNDYYGNPRYVCHFLNLLKENETGYETALNRAKSIGGRKFHNKQYGGGIVFQSYNIESTEQSIIDLLNTPEETKVIFRKFPEGDIIALFPEMLEGNYLIGSYMHIGQHSAADYNLVVNGTKPATPEEYKDLKSELESIGYNLIVRTKAKINYK